MGYQMWCEAVRSAILATAWLLVFIFFAILMCHAHYAVNWYDKLRFLHLLAVLSPVSVIGRG